MHNGMNTDITIAFSSMVFHRRGEAAEGKLSRIGAMALGSSCQTYAVGPPWKPGHQFLLSALRTACPSSSFNLATQPPSSMHDPNS